MASLRPLIWLLNLALLGAVSYSAAGLSMRVLEQRLERAAPVAVAVRARPEQRHAQEPLPLAAFQPVLDANIFGARRSEVKSQRAAGGLTAPGAGSESIAAAVAPATLNVMLTGTAILGDRSFAFVADSAGRNEQMYRLWDCLPAGNDHPTRSCQVAQAKLMSVQPRHIVVEFRGERQTIELTQERPKPPPVAAARPAVPVRTGAPPGDGAALSGDGSNATFPMSQQGNVIDVRVPGAEVNKAFENFADVLKQARVVPYNDDNGQGFLIRSIKPGSIFARIGLNDQDKIRAVNGEPITTADQALRLLTMFRNEKEIQLDLNRGGQDVQLNYVIE